jgi:hypothetical protein
MTNPSDDLLATSEGVDEGSAASTDEGPRSTEELTGVTNPISQALGDAPSTDASDAASPAPPVDVESDDSRAARAAAGPGQQLEAGEG